MWWVGLPVEAACPDAGGAAFETPCPIPVPDIPCSENP